ncbi:MAG: diphosphomevalonate decarboxylase [Wenzhouxiangella sp.]|nr:diphosphomevalonate decarboxylase [Wenzhouxiangella sp.]
MSVRSAAARAGANIALVKYWGKRDPALNLPAAGSISITLDALQTQTRLEPDPGLAGDLLQVNGQDLPSTRVSQVLDLMRALAGGGPHFRVSSRNNFPTGAGLASSASAFAALVVAADQALGLALSATRLSALARRGSGSAARSLFGGFVEMHPGQAESGDDAVATALAGSEHWPLAVVVAVTDPGPKAVSSTEGMQRTMQTSPYYPAWVASVEQDLSEARAAILGRDFQRLADVAEHSALKMHASALAARPGLLYWNAATLLCMERIRTMRAAGTAVFFTIDAGPQLKAVCLPDDAAAVAAALKAIDGVGQVIVSSLGAGAAVLA